MCMNYLNFSQIMSSSLQKVWVNGAPCEECMHYVDLFGVFDLKGREIFEKINKMS